MQLSSDPVKLFTFYGVHTYEGIENDHVKADCPFCGKERHFFINIKSLCWDCKVCGIAGNEYQFLEHKFNSIFSRTKAENIQALATNRGLPIEAFQDDKIGYENGRYYLPIYNEFNRLCNLSVYQFGKACINSPRIPVFPIGIQNLYDIDKGDAPIYLCEGYWDAIACRYLLSTLEKDGVAVGMPSAGSFKLGWIDYFHNKTVYVCYDNDKAGFDGSIKVKQYIDTVVKEIKYIHWPKGLATGYDLRNLVQVGIKSDLSYSYQSLQNYLKEKHPIEIISEEVSKKNGEVTESSDDEVYDIVTYQEVIDEFRKWLDIDDDFEDAIKLTLATVLSPKLPDSDPLWLFLVGPPGCGKSAILTSLKGSKKFTEFQSTLSSTALISGWIGKRGTAFDPSLIPKLDKKCLVLKDFTEVLKKNQQEKDTIFSILRGAFDGTCERMFGQGTRREYNSRFAIVAGVTREIYAASTANVGERFLKYNMLPKNIDDYDRQEMAMESALFGEQTRLSVVDKVDKFLNNHFDTSATNLRNLIPEWFRKRIMPLATLIANLRTQVIRYEKGMLQYEPIYKPQAESGNRLSVQFQRLGLSLALVENKTIDESIYKLIKKVALYTVHDYTIDILKLLIEQEKPINLKTMEELTGLSFLTVKMYAADMLMLDMLDKIITTIDGKPNVTYIIKPNIKKMYTDAQL